MSFNYLVPAIILLVIGGIFLMLTTKDYVNYENTIVKERENPPPTGSTAPSIDNEVLLKSSQQNAIVSIILITGGVVMITKIIKKTIRKA